MFRRLRSRSADCILVTRRPVAVFTPIANIHAAPGARLRHRARLRISWRLAAHCRRRSIGRSHRSRSPPPTVRWCGSPTPFAAKSPPRPVPAFQRDLCATKSRNGCIEAAIPLVARTRHTLFERAVISHILTVRRRRSRSPFRLCVVFVMMRRGRLRSAAGRRIHAAGCRVRCRRLRCAGARLSACGHRKNGEADANAC